MTVKQLIEKLSVMSPDAQVEFEIPPDPIADKTPEVYPKRTGDRYLVRAVRETFYGTPENRWVEITN